MNVECSIYKTVKSHSYFRLNFKAAFLQHLNFFVLITYLTEDYKPIF
jgi:hypothetical protein